MAEKLSVEDVLKCPVCLETHTELKTLPCQHSFCQHCLEDWIEKKGALECPNCRQVHSVAESKLQLPLNAAKTIEPNNSSMPKCCCGEGDVNFYCEQCSQYLCKACKKSHDLFPALKNHQLQKLDCLEECLAQPICQLHEKELDFFCNTCNILICAKCKDTDHQDDDEKHEPVQVVDAFEEFKDGATVLMTQANVYITKLQTGIKKCTTNASKLSASKPILKKDISNTVGEIFQLVSEYGKSLEEKLDEVCDVKNEKTNSQIDELNAEISTVKEKQDAIAKLLKGKAASALQSGQEVVANLKEMLDNIPETEPRDDGKVYYTVKKDHVSDALKKHGIGVLTEKPNANIFEILSESPLYVLEGSKFCEIKIAQNSECEADLGLMSAAWICEEFLGKGMKKKVEIKHIREEQYAVELFSSSRFDSTSLHINYVDSPIKRSPISVYFYRYGIVNTINPFLTTGGTININNLLVSKNDYFIVVDTNGQIGKFKSNSGAYITNLVMHYSACCGIYELSNNDLVFCESQNKKIRFYNASGQVYKSFTTGKSNPLGFDVNESLGLVYVAESGCVNVFDMMSGEKIKTIGTEGNCEGQMKDPSGVAVTKDGSIIVADTGNSRVQLFDKEGKFKCILICGGNSDGFVNKPSQVIVDKDENIIIASQHKVQVFDSKGKLIRAFPRDYYNYKKNKYFNEYVISISSYKPRSLAVAGLKSTEITIINY